MACFSFNCHTYVHKFKGQTCSDLMLDHNLFCSLAAHPTASQDFPKIQVMDCQESNATEKACKNCNIKFI